MRNLIITLLLCTAAHAQSQTEITGTVCRLNRHVDRMIVASGDHERVRVVVPDSATMTFEGTSYRIEDLRPGARVRVIGTSSGDRVEATSLQVKFKVADTIFDALLGPRKTVVGRFSVREAKTEYFSLNTGDGNYVRVEAKSAYGPKGRVRVKDLQSGDLLELSGDWKSRDELHASYIKVITDEELTSCRARARRGETKEQTTAREAAEQKFLDGVTESD
jgi:hypothetical protein